MPQSLINNLIRRTGLNFFNEQINNFKADWDIEKTLFHKKTYKSNKSSCCCRRSIESYYCVLSQLLSGNVSMKDEIKEQVKKISLELLNKSERELQIPSIEERSIIEHLRNNELNQFPI